MDVLKLWGFHVASDLNLIAMDSSILQVVSKKCHHNYSISMKGLHDKKCFVLEPW